MSISLDYNAEVALHVVKFYGKITFEELTALGALHRSRPDWAGGDTINILDDAVDVSSLTNAHLDALRRHYRDLHQSFDLYVLRRAAWICRSASACAVLEYWLADRHSHDGQSSEVCLVANLSDASCLFSQEEIAAVEVWRGFSSIGLIEADASTSAGGE